MSLEDVVQRQAALIRQLQGALGGTRLIAGSVSAAGVPVAGVGTGGYTVTYISAGVYQIHYAIPFNSIPVMTATAWSNAAEAVSTGVFSAGVTSGYVRTFAVSGAAAADRMFDFTIRGT